MAVVTSRLVAALERIWMALLAVALLALSCSVDDGYDFDGEDAGKEGLAGAGGAGSSGGGAAGAMAEGGDGGTATEGGAGAGAGGAAGSGGSSTETRGCNGCPCHPDLTCDSGLSCAAAEVCVGTHWASSARSDADLLWDTGYWE